MTRDAVERYAFSVAKRLRFELEGSRVFANEDAHGYGTVSVGGSPAYERMLLVLQHNGRNIEVRLGDAEDDIKRWGKPGMLPAVIWRNGRQRRDSDRATTRLWVLDKLRWSAPAHFLRDRPGTNAAVTLDLGEFIGFMLHDARRSS